MILLNRLVEPGSVEFAPVAGAVMRRHLVGRSVLFASVRGYSTLVPIVSHNCKYCSELKARGLVRLKGSAICCLPGL